MLRKLLLGMLAAPALAGCAIVPYDEPGYVSGSADDYGGNGYYGYAGPPAIYGGPPVWVGGEFRYGSRRDGDGGYRGDSRRDSGRDERHFAHNARGHDRDRTENHHG